MCKAVDREMTICDICVLKKSGGKRGDFERDGNH
jgi:cyclic pyranopterin phosphate synthase